MYESGFFFLGGFATFVRTFIAMKFKDFEICKRFAHKDKAKIIRYVQECYSKNSELNKIDNLEARRIEACKLVGLDPEQNRDIIDQTNKQVNELIYEYLTRFQNSNEYQQWVSDQQLFWDIQKDLMKPVEGEDREKQYDFKLKMSEKCAALLTRIKSRFNEMYTVEDVGKDTVELIESNVRMLRVEDRVTRKSV